MALLTACNAQSEHDFDNDSHGGDPQDVTENDCGNARLHRDLNSIAIFSASTKDLRSDTGVYEWRAKQGIGLDIWDNGGGFNGGSTIPQENLAACAAVKSAFGSLGLVPWSGERNEAFFEDLTYVYIDPDFDFVYTPRTDLTLQQWRAAGEPSTAEGKLVSAALNVRYSKSHNGGTQSIIDTEMENMNSEVTLHCDHTQQIKYLLKTFNQPGNRDLGTCEQDAQSGQWECLAVSAVADFEGCTFTTATTMIPDGAGDYYRVALGGKFTRNDDDGYAISISDINILSPYPAP
ncbi:hypothetical protein MED297_11980 [Reinekea sp. MED297]|uniref:Uncharacterized protein n=1 Tax=Reinekea blandensis MED297 TaxID=314283 RepID=A4BBC1_9GAMM|nr:hypothetical protein MED297_11980 [Reinekea sp. MED297] [Reinekea blandensis MED297]